MRPINTWRGLVSLVACGVLAAGGLTPSAASAALTDGLVAHWTFDDNTPGNEYVDSAGANHGAAQGTVPALATGRVGPLALELAGGGTINVGSSADFDTTAYTVSAWLNADTASGWRTAVGSWFGGATWMHMGNDDGTTFGDHGGGQTSGGAVVPGQWYHVVSVRNPGVENQLWINGQKVPQTSAGTPQIPGANNVYLGTKDGAGNMWDGKIDDVGIWSRPLAPAEVQEVYRKGLAGVGLAGAPPAASGAVSEYHFDGNMYDSGDAGVVVDDLAAYDTATNSPGAAPNYQPGVVGQAIRLGDGGGAQWVGSPDSADADTPATYTLEGFIKPDQVTGEHQRLVLHWAGGNAYHLGLFGDQLSQFHGEAGGGTPNVQGGTIVPGNWYHVAAVADGSDIRIFLDGALVGTVPYDGTIANSSNRFFLGSDPPNSPYLGLMDEVRVFSSAQTQDYLRARAALLNPQAPNPAAGLVSYYPFQGDGQDRAAKFVPGSGLADDHLTAVGNVSYVPGLVGQAVRLDGGYFTAANSPDVQLPASFTVEAWINPDNPTKTWNRFLLNWGAGEQAYHVALHDGKVSLFIQEADGNVFEVAAGGRVAAGQWQHIAAVLDADTLTGTVYLNGVAVDDGTFDGTLKTALLEGLGLGDSAGAPADVNRYFGLVDELAVWDVALTGDQIRTHYLEFENGYGLEYIPEPATMLLAGLAVAGLGGYVRRRRRA